MAERETAANLLGAGAAVGIEDQRQGDQHTKLGSEIQDETPDFAVRRLMHRFGLSSAAATMIVEAAGLGQAVAS